MRDIFFGTKEQNNARRRQEFLKLSPSERFHRFLQLIAATDQLQTELPKEKKNNFVLIHKSNAV